MSSTPAEVQDKLIADSKTHLVLRILMIWHIAFSIVGLVGSVLVWQAESTPAWLKILYSAILGVSAIFNSVAAFFIRQRKHRGRTISLTINYLGFLACFFIFWADKRTFFVSFWERGNFFLQNANNFPYILNCPS